MIRLLRLLLYYTRRQFLQWFAWRAFLVTLVLNQAVMPLIGLAVWSTALPESRGIAPYYLALLAMQLFTASYENHTFSNGIYDGSLSNVLLKPHPVIVAPLGENVAIRIWHIAIGLPLIALIGASSGATVEYRWVLLAGPAIVAAAALRFLFTYLLALAAFWTQQAHGLVGLGTTLIFLLGGAAAPIPFLPATIQPWVAALPFRAMLGFPAEIASGSLTSAQILQGYSWQLVWLALFLPAAIMLWRSGVRHYTSVGG